MKAIVAFLLQLKKTFTLVEVSLISNPITYMEEGCTAGSLAWFMNLKKLKITVHGYENFFFPNHENKKVPVRYPF